MLMLFNRRHKLTWLSYALRLLMVVCLLSPRIAWGQCHCSAEACNAAEGAAPAEQQQTTPAADKGCCCCSDSGSSCCCCSPSDEESSKSSSEAQPTPPAQPGTDSTPEEIAAEPQLVVRATAPHPSDIIYQECSEASPGDCGCRQLDVQWTSPVPLTPKQTDPHSLAHLARADQMVIDFAPNLVSQTDFVAPILSAPELQSLHCRWQV